jgi:hypothetical protein
MGGWPQHCAESRRALGPHSRVSALSRAFTWLGPDRCRLQLRNGLADPWKFPDWPAWATRTALMGLDDFRGD